MSTTAPAKATAQSIIVLRFPNLSFDILSKPGTGGTRRRTKTRTTIRAMVNGRAIALEFYHHSPGTWGFRKQTARKFDWRHVSGIAVCQPLLERTLVFETQPSFFRRPAYPRFFRERPAMWTLHTGGAQ